MFFSVILLQKHLVDDFVLGAFSVCACILVTLILYYITRNKGGVYVICKFGLVKNKTSIKLLV